MALTMGPAGGGTERRRLLTAHGAALVAGSLTSALVLIALGEVIEAAVPDGAFLAVLAAVVFAGWAIRSVKPWGLAFPRSRWQVPEQWRFQFPPVFTLTAYGYLLGLGFLTDVVLPAYWLLVGLSLVAPAGLVLLAWLAYAWMRLRMTRRLTARVAVCAVPTDALPSEQTLRPARWASASLLAVAALVLVAPLA